MMRRPSSRQVDQSFTCSASRVGVVRFAAGKRGLVTCATHVQTMPMLGTKCVTRRFLVDDTFRRARTGRKASCLLRSTSDCHNMSCLLHRPLRPRQQQRARLQSTLPWSPTPLMLRLPRMLAISTLPPASMLHQLTTTGRIRR